MMVVEAFSFKDHLRLTDTLEIALEYLELGGFYGIITDLEVLSAYRNLWEKVRALKKLIPVFLKVLSSVKKILYHPKRASSLVECFNSILRPIQQVKKQVTQEFLWLKALHHNIKVFKQGKRKGKSPFQLLGIDFGMQDWIELLENYQLAT